jgi:glycosyltransferase involved in cell wall biosynthesis
LAQVDILFGLGYPAIRYQAMRVVVNGWFREQLTTGSGQYLAGLAAWLPRAGSGHEFVLVRPSEGGGSAVLPGWQGVEASTPFDGLSRDLAKVWFEQIAFPRACRRLGADVALVPYWGSPWWRPCPLAVTVHDLIPLLLPLYRGGLLQRAYTWLVSRTARRADAILTDSDAARRDIIACLRIPPQRVHAVHLAADQGFRPVTDAGELARVRAKYRLPEEPFWLYLAGFDARKNVVAMIEGYARAMKAIGGQEPGIRLVVAGRLPERDTPFAPDPRPVVERLGIGGAVHFTGWVDDTDKPALYSLALGALYLSEYEGFGLPVLEAMACGCAVVAGNQPDS